MKKVLITAVALVCLPSLALAWIPGQDNFGSPAGWSFERADHFGRYTVTHSNRCSSTCSYAYSDYAPTGDPDLDAAERDAHEPGSNIYYNNWGVSKGNRSEYIQIK